MRGLAGSGDGARRVRTGGRRYSAGDNGPGWERKIVPLDRVAGVGRDHPSLAFCKRDDLVLSGVAAAVECHLSDALVLVEPRVVPPPIHQNKKHQNDNKHDPIFF